MDTKVDQSLKKCLAEFDCPEGYKAIVNEMSQVYLWLFSQPKKVEDLLKPGQKITSEEQEAKLLGQLAKARNDENERIQVILKRHGVFSASKSEERFV